MKKGLIYTLIIVVWTIINVTTCYLSKQKVEFETDLTAELKELEQYPLEERTYWDYEKRVKPLCGEIRHGLELKYDVNEEYVDIDLDSIKFSIILTFDKSGKLIDFSHFDGMVYSQSKIFSGKRYNLPPSSYENTYSVSRVEKSSTGVAIIASDFVLAIEYVEEEMLWIGYCIDNTCRFIYFKDTENE